MKTDEKQIATLLKLQQCDLELLRVRKKLEELPQRHRILELRKRKQTIEDKKTKVDLMRSGIESDMADLRDEDAQLVDKQDVIQTKIDEVRDDYRSVSSHTKALNGVAKRRNSIESDLIKLETKLNEVVGVSDQVEAALAQVVDRESEEIASFQQEGGALNQAKADLSTRREKLAVLLDGELLVQYEKTAEKCGGVGVCQLKDDACSVCRNSFDLGKLLQIKSERPLSECPQCKRIMVVD